jgi:hypothetical protein
MVRVIAGVLPTLCIWHVATQRELMATWQRLSYECVALLFKASLYLRRFAGWVEPRQGEARRNSPV